MLSFESKYFPRNPDGSLKRKKPCQTPGCGHPNWHLCLKNKPDDGTFARLVADRNAKRSGRALRKEERNTTIIKEYTENNMSMKAIAAKHGIGYQTVRDVIHESDVQVRPRGVTIGSQTMATFN